MTVTVDGEEVHAVTYDEDAVFEAMEKVTPRGFGMDADRGGPGSDAIRRCPRSPNG